MPRRCRWDAVFRATRGSSRRAEFWYTQPRRRRAPVSAHGRPPVQPEALMNKKELIAKLAKSTGLSQAKAGEVLNALFDAD
ncbi:MAG: HU family DNA-binding protein, partial [Myxococcota bacterium]